MSRKIIAAVLALSLSGCSQTAAEVSVTVSESAAEESAAKAAEEASAKTTESKGTIKVTPADELCDVYPKRIMYPEKTETNITAEKAEINEEFKNGEFVVYKFSSAYPVFSGGDEEVVKKINEYIKNYIYEIYNELERKTASAYTSEYDIDGFPYKMCGFIYENSFTAGDYLEYRKGWNYDINGNILTVYFEDYIYGAGAVHGSEAPRPMVFDLRSGERVDFNKLIADTDGLSEILCKSMYDYLYLNSSTYRDTPDNYVGYNADYNEELKSKNFYSGDFLVFGTDEDGDYVAAYTKANYIMSVCGGCLSFYLSPYQYGSYADGIRRIDVPIKDVLQYLTEEGRELFADFKSAESVPVNVIEYEYKKYFDTDYIVRVSSRNYDTAADYGSEGIPLVMRTPSDTDYDFIELFPDAYILELNGCRISGFEKIAEMKNIKRLGLNYCEFDGISGLLGSNINYIYGKGHNIPKAQADEFKEQGDDYGIASSVINDEFGLSSWLGY